MRAIIVDDDAISLELLEFIVSEASFFESVEAFNDPLEVISWSIENRIDVAFLDIHMPGISGLDLATVIQKMWPGVFIVFITASEKYALDAFKLHAFDYLMKPVDAAAISGIFEHIKAVAPAESVQPEETQEVSEEKVQPLPLPQQKLMSVRCFGNFDAFVNDEPVRFSYSKTKELLAYLVHRRGTSCSVKELADILYPEVNNPEHQQSRLRTLVSDMSKTFKNLGCESVLYKTRGYLSVIPKRIDCDYYDYLDSGSDISRSYNGEYMAQYEWAEYVNAYLDQAGHSGK